MSDIVGNNESPGIVFLIIRTKVIIDDPKRRCYSPVYENSPGQKRYTCVKRRGYIKMRQVFGNETAALIYQAIKRNCTRKQQCCDFLIVIHLSVHQSPSPSERALQFFLRRPESWICLIQACCGHRSLRAVRSWIRQVQNIQILRHG